MEAKLTHAEIVTGDTRNRPGAIRETTDIPDNFGGPAVALYCSVYRFGLDFKDFAEKANSVSQYTGPCRAIGLHFDFDGDWGDDIVLREVQAFTETILSNDRFGCTIEDFRLFFSGNKGFHVWISNDETRSLPVSSATPEQLKRLCIALAGKYGTFDWSIYDKTRLLRVANSRHPKSGLYKIPMFASELWTCSMPEIRALARQQRSISDPGTIGQLITENQKRAHYGIA